MQGVIALSDSNFDTEVLNSSTPVAVDFWAEWCGPCRVLGPIMEQVAEEIGDVVKIAKLNVDDSRGVASKYQIMSIPTVIVFKEGKMVDKFVGVQPKQQIIDRLRALA
ncbi:MAG: thioredoxin [Armatimonadota bacterium]